VRLIDVRCCRVLLLVGSCIAVNNLPIDGAEPAPTEPTARVVVDRGYDQAIELRHGRARVVLCPEAGGRVLEFSFDGRNTLYFDPKEAEPEVGKPRPMTAGRFDVGPELTVIPHPQLWSGQWTAEITGPTAARLTSVRCEKSGLRLIRDFELAIDTALYGATETRQVPRLDCKQTIVNESNEVREVCHWGRSFSPGGGIALVPLGDRPSKFPAKYAMYEDSAVINVRNVDERIRERDGFIEVLAPPRKPKLGFDSYAGWLGYLMPGDLLFAKRFRAEPDLVYNEAAGLTLSIWYPEGARIELEPIGPRERLKPGERASFTETWTIHAHPFPKSGAQVDLNRLAKQVNAETTPRK
jgi:hypothetical protein